MNGEIYRKNRMRDLNRMQFIKHKFHSKISWKELDRIQQEEKKRQKDIFKKYQDDLKEQKEQEQKQQQQQQQQQQMQSLQVKSLDPNNLMSAEKIGSEEQMKTSQVSQLNSNSNNLKQDLSNNNSMTVSRNRQQQPQQLQQLQSNSSLRLKSASPDDLSRNNVLGENEKANSDVEGKSQEGNTQIDLDDSASSDDFFGDIFEGFMSEDDDDSGKSKKGEDDDVSDSSLAEANQKFKQVQKKKLVKKKKEYGVNYVPKLLTTNLFFQPLESMKLNRDQHHHQAKLKSTFKQAKEELKKQKYKSTSRKQPEDFKKELEYNFFQPIRDAMVEGKNKKEIIQQFIQPQSAKEYDFQGMDLHIGNQVVRDLSKDGLESKPLQWVGEDYQNEQNIEHKYKRDLRYSRRILNIKRISELENKCRTINYSKFPNKITFDRQIKDEGFLVEAKIGFQSDLQILKTKQERIIQGEIKHAGKKNLRDLIFSNRDSVLFQDANQLKHVYYDYIQAKKEQEKLKHQQQNERDLEKTIVRSSTMRRDQFHQQHHSHKMFEEFEHQLNRQSKMNLEDIEKSPQNVKNSSNLLTSVSSKNMGNSANKQPSQQSQSQGLQTQQTQQLMSHSFFMSPQNNNLNSNTPHQQSLKNIRQKWTSSTYNNLHFLENQGGSIGGTQSLQLSKHTSPKDQSRRLHSPNKGYAKKQDHEADDLDYMVKLAGQKSNVLSKAQQIQKRYENDQKELAKYDNFTQQSIKEKLGYNSMRSNKSLKIVVDEVTVNLQKDKKQLQQTKFKLGVTKNMVVDDNFGQILIERSEQKLAKSIQGMARDVNKGIMSFTEVVRLARLKKKVESAANKGVGSLTINKI